MKRSAVAFAAVVETHGDRPASRQAEMHPRFPHAPQVRVVHAMKKKRPELAGEFSEPIVRPDPLLMAFISFKQSDKRRRLIKQAEAAWPLAERHARIQLVAGAYGIDFNDPDFWMKLSLSLCQEFIEETRIYDTKPRGPGAPKKNSKELWKAVQTIKDEGNSTAEACRILSDRKGPWKGKPWKAIETRFYEVDKGMAQFRDAPETPFTNYINSILKGDLDDFDDIAYADAINRKNHDNSHH